jgi:hypothetical protein
MDTSAKGALLPLLESLLKIGRRLSPYAWLASARGGRPYGSSTASEVYVVLAAAVAIALYKYAQPVQPSQFTKILALICALRLGEIIHSLLDWLLLDHERTDDEPRRRIAISLIQLVEVAALAAAGAGLLGSPISLADSARALFSLQPPATFASFSIRVLGWLRLASGLLLFVALFSAAVRSLRRRGGMPA